MAKFHITVPLPLGAAQGRINALKNAFDPSITILEIESEGPPFITDILWTTDGTVFNSDTMEALNIALDNAGLGNRL